MLQYVDQIWQARSVLLYFVARTCQACAAIWCIQHMMYSNEVEGIHNNGTRGYNMEGGGRGEEDFTQSNANANAATPRLALQWQTILWDGYYGYILAITSIWDAYFSAKRSILNAFAAGYLCFILGSFLWMFLISSLGAPLPGSISIIFRNQPDEYYATIHISSLLSAHTFLPLGAVCGLSPTTWMRYCVASLSSMRGVDAGAGAAAVLTKSKLRQKVTITRRSNNAYRFAATDSVGRVGLVVARGAVSAVFGAWCAAAAHLLDWDVPWQRFPEANMIGILLAYCAVQVHAILGHDGIVPYIFKKKLMAVAAR